MRSHADPRRERMTPTAGAGLPAPAPAVPFKPVFPGSTNSKHTQVADDGRCSNSRSLAIAVSAARPYSRVVMLLNVDRMVRRTRSGLSGPVWMFGAGHL